MNCSFVQVNGMKKVLLIASVFAIYAIGYSVAYGTTGIAYAQYMGNVGSGGETGVGTLEEQSYYGLIFPVFRNSINSFVVYCQSVNLCFN